MMGSYRNFDVSVKRCASFVAASQGWSLLTGVWSQEHGTWSDFDLESWQEFGKLARIWQYNTNKF